MTTQTVEQIAADLHQQRLNNPNPQPVEMAATFDVYGTVNGWYVVQDCDETQHPLEAIRRIYRTREDAKTGAIKYVYRAYGKDTIYGAALVKMIRAL